MKPLLLNFLQGKSQDYLPPVILRVYNLDPLQVMDDNRILIDISSLQDEILEMTEGNRFRNYDLYLNDWRFVFNRVPNSQDYYFDIEATDFQ